MSSSYIDSNLMNGERVIFRTKPHWIIYGNAIGLCVLCLFSLMVLPFTGIGQIHFFGYKLWLLLLVFSGIGALVTSSVAHIDYISSEFGITNKRVLIKLGFISRRSLEVLLPKVESICVIQSIPGRIFKYGTIIISGTGGSKDAFRNIPEPLEFRKKVQTQVDIYEDEHK